jgi:hypothetical protein
MPRLTIDLAPAAERKLRDLAVHQRVSEEDICREAVEEYLRTHEAVRLPGQDDPYASLREMIGLVETGPTNTSIQHDVRETDEA